jgi:hypothetical protein
MMHISKFAVLLALLACVSWPAVSCAQEAADIERAVDTMVRLCLGGGHTEATSGGGGGGIDLSLRTLDVRGKIQGEFKITKSRAEGLVEGINNAMSQVAANEADKVRSCLQPVRDRVLDLMLPPGKQAARPSDAVQVAGEWLSEVFDNPNVDNQKRQFDFTFKQNDSRLLGDVLFVYPPDKPTVRAKYGFSGKVDGNTISFDFIVQLSSGPIRMTFYGIVLPDKINFTWMPEDPSGGFNYLPSEFVARRITSDQLRNLK